MLDRLFVYGTLRGSFDNRYSRLLRAGADFVDYTTVQGSIYRVDHFPAYRPTPAGKVRGELYRLRDPEETLRVLDEYEGPAFERVTVNGAWIYQYREQPPQDSQIASGDFSKL
jgi:gamma-glutamylcyclotransferase (GGCT)/AIG2-like uncharacterized protein YtfP